MYRVSVIKCNISKYAKLKNEVKKVFDKENQYSVDGETWICKTCDSTLNTGNMPVQAWANGLQLSHIPPALKDLNCLERRLISQKIPFMKTVALPKGRQKGIQGPAIYVPTKLHHVCSLLPRLPDDAQIVAMKLKRKLVYNGHYMYEYVRPKLDLAALHWLKENNPKYKNIDVNIDVKNTDMRRMGGYLVGC